MPASETFKVVASFTHYSGANYKALSDAERYLIYAEGDGFGKLPLGELIKINDGWDWSHIRDSSPQAERRMLDTLEGILRRSGHGTPVGDWLGEIAAARDIDAANAQMAYDAERRGERPSWVQAEQNHFSRRFNAAAV